MPARRFRRTGGQCGGMSVVVRPGTAGPRVAPEGPRRAGARAGDRATGWCARRASCLACAPDRGVPGARSCELPREELERRMRLRLLLARQLDPLLHEEGPRL